MAAQLLTLLLLLPGAAAEARGGQSSPAAAPAGAGSPGPPVLEFALGWAGFGDEGVVHHGLLGVDARVYLARRISVGPEIVYMMGPGQDRDLMVTGNLTVDVLAPTVDKPRRVTPFLVAGGGLFRHSDTFQSGTFSSTEGSFTLGVGLRGWITERTFLAADARAGWEPHIRLAAIVGVALGK